MIPVTSVRIRFIRKSSLRKQFQRIEIETDAERRSKLIGKLAEIPQVVTKALIRQSRGKCWYCERKLAPQELVIEHFRPKRRVTGLPGHCGYWWLSANSKNFRIACKNCNCRWTNPDGVVAGKGNYFPLIHEAHRVSSRRADLRVEEPLLFDPLVQSDCDGLAFYRDGMCYPQADDYFEVSRGFSSITLYNLNNPHLVDERKNLWGDIELKAQLMLAVKSADPPLYQTALNWLRDRVQDSSEYAGLARCAVFELNQRHGQII